MLCVVVFDVGFECLVDFEEVIVIEVVVEGGVGMVVE